MLDSGAFWWGRAAASCHETDITCYICTNGYAKGPPGPALLACAGDVMSSESRVLVGLVILVAAAGGLLLWIGKLRSPEPASVPTTSQTQPPAIPASAPSAGEAPVVPVPPVEVPVTTEPLHEHEVNAALTELLGRKAVTSFVRIEEFPWRLAATTDNLGRSHAPAALWPVHPTPGRFTVEELDSGPVIAADNAARYTPFVLLVETVDVGRAADLYVRMYPLLQRTYEELGYPGQSFNQRLIAVIDLLLATPAVEYPVKLQLTEVKGPIPSLRPWVRYEYADPALESLSAGQKILLRVGAVNARRLKAKLAEFRGELVKRAPKR
jgi:hypothetical protein